MKDSKLNSVPIVCTMFSSTVLYHEHVVQSQLHAEDTFELCIITQGEGLHRVLEQNIPCQVGDVHIIPPDTRHAYFSSKVNEHLCARRILFHVSDWFDDEISIWGNPRFCYGVFNDNSAVACTRLDNDTLERVNLLCDMIADEMTEQSDEWRDSIRGYLANLLILISRSLNRAVKNKTYYPSKEWIIVSEVLRQINLSYTDNDFTLRSIAESLHISTSYLSRIFQRMIGISFTAYLRSIRLDYACRLLEKSEMRVEEIVFACGWRDLETFYRNFETNMHMLPNAYRQSKKQTEYNEKGQRRKQMTMSILSEISLTMQQGKPKLVKELVGQALEAGVNPEDILKEGLLDGMSVIGEKFKNNEVFVPEVLVAARAMNMGTQLLTPYLAERGTSSAGKVCIGTVKGDLHDIGKNLVKMMMEGKGLEVIDLGVDVPAETFVKTALEQNCQVICCSALLTTTMHVMEEVVKAATEAGIRDQVKIMIGGAPITDAYCQQIGADAYTPDAARAADVAVELCQMQKKSEVADDNA